VAHLAKLGKRRRADALRGRIGRDELGMRGLERLQLGEEPVILGVGDLRRVLDVVKPVMALDRPAQLRDARGAITQEGRRDAARTPRRRSAAPAPPAPANALRAR